jgi:hypothetical protein
MKCAKWEECSEVSISSEIFNLQEVKTNLRDLGALPGENLTTAGIALALSFVDQAIEQLSQMDPQADLKQ